MPTTPEPPEESAARDLLAAAFGVPVIRHDDGSAPGMFDVEFSLHGESGACEVTIWTDKVAEAQAAAFDRHTGGLIAAPELDHCWWVIVRRGVLLRGLPGRVRPLLVELERAGLDKMDHYQHHSRPDVSALKMLTKLGVEQAVVTAVYPPGNLVFDYFVGGSGFGPNEVTLAVESCLGDPRCADVLAKLTRSGAKHRHLFLWLRDYRWGAWRGMQHGQLPTQRPQLPEAVTAVWTAIEPPFAWLFEPERGWREVRLPCH